MKYINLGGSEIVQLEVPKDPESEIPFYVDWRYVLKPANDTISTVATTSEELTVADVTDDSYVATIKLSGGLAGDIAEVKQLIVTSGGFTHVRRFRLRVEER